MIAPEETAGPAPDAVKGPFESRHPMLKHLDTPAQLPLFVGVLKLESPLMEIFPGRVVPLMGRDPARVLIQTLTGPRFLECMQIPWSHLTGEHKAAIVAKLAEELVQPLEAVLHKLDQVGYYAVQKVHFAAVVQGRSKNEP